MRLRAAVLAPHRVYRGIGCFVGWALLLIGLVLSGCNPTTPPKANPPGINPVGKPRIARLFPRRIPYRAEVQMEAVGSTLLAPDGTLATTGPHIALPSDMWYMTPDGRKHYVAPPSGLVGGIPTVPPIVLTPGLPTDGGTYTDSISNQLFTIGDANACANDVNQWQIPDCWLLAWLEALAVDAPDVRRALAQRNAQGGYDCTFWNLHNLAAPNLGGTFIVKVDGQTGSVAAKVNPYTGSNWIPVWEKAAVAAAKAINNRGTGTTYMGLGWGFAGEAAGYTGCTAIYLQPSSPQLLTAIRANLANGKAMAVGTGQIDWGVSAHCYVVYDARVDSTAPGGGWITLLNPWGGGVDGGAVTISVTQFRAGCGATVCVNQYPIPPPEKPADGNQDGQVDAKDHDLWWNNVSVDANHDGIPDVDTRKMSHADQLFHGNFNGDAWVDALDFDLWQRNVGR